MNQNLTQLINKKPTQYFISLKTNQYSIQLIINRRVHYKIMYCFCLYLFPSFNLFCIDLCVTSLKIIKPVTFLTLTILL